MNTEKFMVKAHPSSMITEAYRKAVTNIQYANIDNEIKTIMITSAMLGEGKTTTLCNIASVMSDLGKRILIIDIDLHKPAVHKFFNLPNKYGLTDLLMNKDDYRKYLYDVYPELDVLTVGKIPSNPAELVNSKSIKELLKVLSLNYDYIFLDTPPIALVSDSINISTYTDAVILVIAYGETEIETVRKSIESLKHVNANIIGTVLNKLPVSRQHKHYKNCLSY